MKTYGKDEVLRAAVNLARLGGEGASDAAEMLMSFAQTLGETVAVHQAVFTGTLDGRHVGLHGNLESVAVLQSYVERHDKAVEPVAVPDGWQLVPMQPTAEMEDAAYDTFEIDDAKTQGFNSGTDARNAIYKAMLSAAPHHPTTEKGCE